jgi:hypothetical protein
MFSANRGGFNESTDTTPAKETPVNAANPYDKRGYALS